jgi:hypothetical protein
MRALALCSLLLAATSAGAADPVPPPDAAPPQPATIPMRFSSAPIAEVFIDGVSYGWTPLFLQLLAQHRTIEVEFRRPDRPTVVKRLSGDQPQRLHVVLPGGGPRLPPPRK